MADPPEDPYALICLRFSPREPEIFTRFLIPRLNDPNDGELPNSLIKTFAFYNSDPIVANRPAHHFFPPDNWWYFVRRTRIAPHSMTPSRVIQNNPNQGSWVRSASVQIFEGNLLLGRKRTFDYKNPQNQRTGWRFFEYERLSNAFQPLVVVHLIYKPSLNQSQGQGDQADQAHHHAAQNQQQAHAGGQNQQQEQHQAAHAQNQEGHNQQQAQHQPAHAQDQAHAGGQAQQQAQHQAAQAQPPNPDQPADNQNHQQQAGNFIGGNCTYAIYNLHGGLNH